jgi:hypothetical protein
LPVEVASNGIEFSAVCKKSMKAKKQKAESKKVSSSKKETMEQLRRQHPYETDSQIQNRYGDGREQSGSDGTNQDSGDNNH